MMKKSYSAINAIVLLTLLCHGPCLAAAGPSGPQMATETQARQMQEQSQQLLTQIEQPGESARAPAAQAAEAPATGAAPTIFVRVIFVTGYTLFSPQEIYAITNPYQNKYLSLAEIKNVARLITDLYRKKGYLTSRAYVPDQEFKAGVLEIKVIEGTVGSVQITGNRYFSTALIQKYVSLKTGHPFNYNDLKGDLWNANAHPDMDLKAVLLPGQTPGSTDVALNEDGRLPVHVSIGYDDYLPYYLDRGEYVYTFTDNNLSGHGDMLNFQYNRALDSQLYYYYSGSYVYPVTPETNVGFLYSRSNLLLGKSFAVLDSAGESKMYSFFGSQKLIQNNNLELNLTFGFDNKDVDNYLEGELSSRDDLNIPKLGLDLDMTDDFGRTIISDEADYGVVDSTDVTTSRIGAGNSFFLDTLNLLRLQRLPWDSTLLWKNQFQFSPSVLTATEQFQAGGPANNRGFGVASAVGDEGYAMSWELALPPYFVPKDYQLPYIKADFYDAFRFIGFYDWTNLHLNEIQPGESSYTTLGSAGCGARLNLAQDLSASYEIAWPLQGQSADGKSVHQWVQVTMSF